MRKKEFRELCLKKVKNITYSKRLVGSKIVTNRAEEVVSKVKAKSILLFIPMSHEPDIYPLIKRLAPKHNVYVPFMEGESFKVVKYRLPLRKKRFGIKEPNNSHFFLSKIDLAVVPVVGVDGKMRRIGFGKGMYDRFFATLKKRPITLFVQLKSCRTNQIVTDEYDITADYYITPKDFIVRGKRDDNRNNNRRCGSNRKRYCSIFYN